MRFKENKEEYKRNGIFLLLIIFTAILQNTHGLFPQIYNASAMLIIPLVICISMFEREIISMALGLAAGMIWDFYSTRMDGFYSVLLVLTGFFCSYLIRRYMRNNIVTALVYTGLCSFVCVVAYWVFFVAVSGARGAGMLLLSKYLPSVLYTLILTPVYYYFIKMISQKYRKATADEE
ncbi:MAG: rod shape-determining protein MreD [Clostridia bacterium]|nr:rod shape-determining protein MreD [Clostridia bacterium]